MPSSYTGQALVLASASPRRAELLAGIVDQFAAIPSKIDEAVPETMPADDAVHHLALAKARAVLAGAANAIVLGADTLVAIDGEALGKPRGAADARRMLERLRGRQHDVLTGVCLVAPASSLCRVVRTQVTMRNYSEGEIDATIQRGTPFDKAGAYAIQDLQFSPVLAIHGCYCNVMGLPLWTVWDALCRMQFDGALRRPDETFDRCAGCPLRPEPSVDRGQGLPRFPKSPWTA